MWLVDVLAFVTVFLCLSSMESLYQKANKQTTKLISYFVLFLRPQIFVCVCRLLMEVESHISSLGHSYSPQLEQEIEGKLEELFSDIQRLEQMVAKEPPSRKQSAKL